MAINLDLIIKKSSQNLQRNILGGVKRKSAVEAIKSAANETLVSAEDVFLKEKAVMKKENVGIVRKYEQMLEEKNAYTLSLEEKNAKLVQENNKANELAKMLRNSISEKFKSIAASTLELKQEKAKLAEEQKHFAQKTAKNNAILNQVQKAFNFKLVRETPSHSIYARSNRNGAMMQKTYNNKGQLEAVEVKLPGDYYRKTVYEQAGSESVRKKTTTNTSGIDKSYQYSTQNTGNPSTKLSQKEVLPETSHEKKLSSPEIENIINADYFNKSGLNVIDYSVDESQILIKALKPKMENPKKRQNLFKNWLNKQLQIPEHLKAEKDSNKHGVIGDVVKYKNDKGIVEKTIKFNNSNQVGRISNYNPKTGELKESLSLMWEDNNLSNIFIDRSNGDKNTRIFNIFLKDNEFNRADLIITHPSKGVVMKEFDDNITTSSLYLSTYKKDDIPIWLEYVKTP